MKRMKKAKLLVGILLTSLVSSPLVEAASYRVEQYHIGYASIEKYNRIGDNAIISGITFKILGIELTEERNQYEDEYENVIAIKYEITNNRETDYLYGLDLSLFADNLQASTYALDNALGTLSPGRIIEGYQYFAFNGTPELIELEFKPDLEKERAILTFSFESMVVGDSQQQLASEVLIEDETKEEAADVVTTDSGGYTDADIAYWNSLAYQYGFQSYGGQTDFASFVAYAQQAVANAQMYGDPYYEEPVYSEPTDETYIDSSDGYLYENDYGPEESFDPYTYEGW